MALEYPIRIKVNATTSGLADFGLGSAVSTAFRSFSGAGVTTGATIDYTAFTATEFESGTGVYTAAGPTLSRVTIDASSNVNNKVNFATAPVIIATFLPKRLPEASDAAYSGTWDGSLLVPTQNAVFDKIETIAPASVVLTADTSFYVRSTPAVVTISVASPAVVSWTSHPLSVGDAVVFHMPEDMFGNVSISNASPAVVTFAGHGLTTNDTFHFETSFGSTSAGLPTGITANTTYHVIATGLTSSEFQFSATQGGAAINTSSAGDGNHYCFRDAQLPTGVTAGTLYYVIAAGFGANSFEISTSPGGSAVNTSGTTFGKITATTGNDANDGTAPDRAHAWLMPQAGYNYITENVDTAGFTVTMELADSLYLPITGDSVILMDRPWMGFGIMRIRGNQTYPTNAHVSPGSRNGIYVRCLIPSQLWIESLMFTTTGFKDGVGSETTGRITITNCVFGANDWQIAMRANGRLALARNSVTCHLGTSVSNSEAYNIMIRGGGSPGGFLQASASSTCEISDPIIILNNPTYNVVGFAFNNGVISLDGGGFFHGKFTGTIYYCSGGRILSSLSFGTPFMQMNRPRPIGQSTGRTGGGSYDNLGDPHFLAHKNGTAQNITSNAVTLLTFATEVFDEGVTWDTVTSSLEGGTGYYDYYYPPSSQQSPMYYLEAGVHITAFGSGTTAIKLHIYLDGSLFRTVAQQNIPTGLTDITLKGSTIFRSPYAGNYDFRIEFTGLTSGTATIDGTSTQTWVAGYRSI